MSAYLVIYKCYFLVNNEYYSYLFDKSIVTILWGTSRGILLGGLRPPRLARFQLWNELNWRECPFGIYTEAFAMSLSQKIMHVALLLQICFFKKVVWYVFKADETQTKLPVASWFLELRFSWVSSCLLNLRYVFFIFKQHFVVFSIAGN